MKTKENNLVDKMNQHEDDRGDDWMGGRGQGCVTEVVLTGENAAFHLLLLQAELPTLGVTGPTHTAADYQFLPEEPPDQLGDH